MSGRIIYTYGVGDGDHECEHHECELPERSRAATGSVWMCDDCGKAFVKTGWTYSPDNFRPMHWFEFKRRRAVKRALALRRRRVEQQHLKRDEEIVNSWKPS